MIKTPVVLICFNRPVLTKKVFNQIKKKKPSKLFIIMDGPRPENFKDEQNVKKVKKIFRKVNWKCKVYKNYAKSNLGLKDRVITGLNWVFRKVDKAIILEDDCYPSDIFFDFCDKMLSFYQKNKKVSVITGNNFQKKPINNNSYYFSKYSHIWGWATWRRTWKLFNDNDHRIEKYLKSSNFKNQCKRFDEQKYWSDMHSQIKRGILKSWAYYFLLSMWKNNGLTLTPNLNLVKNLGINYKSSSNLNDPSLQVEISKTESIFPLVHPNFVKVSEEADNFVFYSIFKKNIKIRIINKVKKMISWIK
jgi:hypothetical protein